MSDGRSFTSVSVALALALALALASMQAASTAPKQPTIDARVAPLLKVGNLSFKDLNRNGVLDPYEDWRLPVDKRVADLLSRMTLEEKAGLMQITSFNAGSLDEYLNQRNIHYLILRDNITARELAARANTAQELAEKSRLGTPIVFASNPRNHVRDNLVYEEAEAAGEFSSWPGTLGLAATNDIKLIRSFAEIAERESKVERHIRLLTPLAFIPPRTLAAIIDGTGPHDATVTGLAQAVPYRWDRSPAGQVSERTPGDGR